MKRIYQHLSYPLMSLFCVLFFASCKEDPLPEEGVDADFTHFEFAYTTGDIRSATIDRVNKTITATIDDVADLSDLSPVFVLSHQAKAYVNDEEQISGTSKHDFTKAIEYKVVSGNKQVVNIYKVTITAESGVVVPINDMIVDKTTELSASEYYVKGNIIVEEGVYLSIRPGCKFRLSANSKIIVKPNATFLAIGTAERPIKFFADSTDSPTQAWAGFEFDSPNEVEFNYCSFEHGGNNHAMMALTNTQIGFQHCKVNNVYNTGFDLNATSIFRTFDQDTLNNVGENGNYYPIHADNINSLANLGDNNKISKGILVQNSDIKRSITLYSQTCPYIFVNDITCNVDNITFFITEGVEIWMSKGKGIYLGDSKMLFDAKGSITAPVIFSGVDKTAGSWDGIVFRQNILPVSKMSLCEIRFGGNDKNLGAIRCSGTTTEQLFIQSCAIMGTKSHCIYFEKNADATLTDVIYNVATGFDDVFYEQ